MSELKRINRLMADLKRRLARGGMTYNEAVTVDHLISVFERMAAEIETDRLDPLPLPETAIEIYLRGRSDYPSTDLRRR